MITREELELLKNIEYGGYRFIARDKDDTLWIFKARPYKSEVNEVWMSNLDHRLLGNDNLFKNIKWEDKEPCEIHRMVVEAL